MKSIHYVKPYSQILMTELKGVNSENIFELVSESRIGIDRIAVERGRVCLVP